MKLRERKERKEIKTRKPNKVPKAMKILAPEKLLTQRWTEEEHSRLMQAKDKGLTNWKEIAKYMGTRDHQQCKSHYQKKGELTTEEFESKRGGKLEIKHFLKYTKGRGKDRLEKLPKSVDSEHLEHAMEYLRNVAKERLHQITSKRAKEYIKIKENPEEEKEFTYGNIYSRENTYTQDTENNIRAIDLGTTNCISISNEDSKTKENMKISIPVNKQNINIHKKVCVEENSYGRSANLMQDINVVMCEADALWRPKFDEPVEEIVCLRGENPAIKELNQLDL